jgi:5-hydroxyisourate hydrolase-like protein (transthyretin family)
MRKAYLSVLVLLFTSVTTFAASISGTVINKTTGKPSAGDVVELVDLQASMKAVAHTTTDGNGHYSLNSSGMGAYMIRVNHQGGTYFVGVPQAGVSADAGVFDVAARIDGVSVDSDMLLIESASGTLRVHERYLIHNTSQPPRAQFSKNTFEVVLPPGAELDTASTTRPGGIATNTNLIPLNQKGHYTFNVPIQPDKGEKQTLFEVMYHLSYNGKFTFSPQLLMPVDNFVVYLTKGINFKASSGSQFEARQVDPSVDTWAAKNIRPGESISFTVYGEGKVPAQSAGAGRSMGNSAESGNSAPSTHPGSSSASGGNSLARNSSPASDIGAPVGPPDPLTRYKWWILSVLGILLVGAAAFFLRKGGATTVRSNADAPQKPVPSSTAAAANGTSSASLGRLARLNKLKEELFAIESKRLSGTLPEAEYVQIKAELEAALKSALASDE